MFKFLFKFLFQYFLFPFSLFLLIIFVFSFFFFPSTFTSFILNWICSFERSIGLCSLWERKPLLFLHYCFLSQHIFPYCLHFLIVCYFIHPFSLVLYFTHFPYSVFTCSIYTTVFLSFLIISSLLFLRSFSLIIFLFLSIVFFFLQFFEVPSFLHWHFVLHSFLPRIMQVSKVHWTYWRQIIFRLRLRVSFSNDPLFQDSHPRSHLSQSYFSLLSPHSLFSRITNWFIGLVWICQQPQNVRSKVPLIPLLYYLLPLPFLSLF